MNDIERLLLKKDLSKNLKDSEEYKDLLIAIQEKVEYYLTSNPELLFSHLYRLDIDEGLVEKVLKSESDILPSLSLARLILDRQILRVKTKKSFSQKGVKGWEW